MSSQRSNRAMTVRSGPDATSVEIRWRMGRASALAWYALIFTGVLLTLAARRGQFQDVHRMLMVMAACGLGYFILAHLLNATRLAVREGMLLVTHGPVPWFGRVSLPLRDVRRLRFDEKTARLRLHTQLGEELTLLDGLLPERLPGLSDALGDALARGTSARAEVED
jgi:hypothetical protein